MRGINIAIPYFNKQGIAHTLTVGLALQYTVSSSAAAESINSIRTNAPAVYYTQNRMITGEDYNLAPLSSSQDILKIKSVNRTSSGISRNFDIIDATGKYSDITVFADDGYIYKEEKERELHFKFTSTVDIINFIRRNIEKVFTDTDVYNFYITKFDKILFTDTNVIWNNTTSDVNLSTGYFKNAVDQSLLKVGVYSTNSLKYLTYGSLIKFVAPSGKSFKKSKLVTTDTTDSEQTDRLWVKVVKIVGDGTNAGRGVLSNGLGAVSLNVPVPTGAIASRIVPRFTNDLTTDLELEIVTLVSQNLNFGLRYDNLTTSWNIITSSNLDLTSNFSLGKAGDTSKSNIDASWIIAFVKDIDQYVVRVRAMDYIFGSVEQNRFYFDVDQKQYNDQSGNVVKDTVNILGINTGANLISALNQNVPFQIDDTIKFEDGYESTSEIKIAFYDTNSDSIIDNPESFEILVGPDSNLQYLFFEEIVDDTGSTIYTLVDNSNDLILVRQTEGSINITDFTDGQLIYFYDSAENRVKQVNKTTNTLDLKSNYKANIGRRNLKFQYIHNAGVDRRIDPSVSNIIDIYLLTRSYDTSFRNYLAGAVSTEPEAPSSDGLRVNFGSKLNSIKSISDEIIYHPVKYKILFGSKADEKLQAQIKVVKNPNKAVNDNDLKVRIINAINTFFDINNWDFGDKFYLSEMTTYVLNSVSPDVSNMVILPTQTTQAFGSLFEIQSKPNEIFVSGATVDDIRIVSTISAAEVRATTNQIVTTT
jgi:hypothetical protein